MRPFKGAVVCRLDLGKEKVLSFIWELIPKPPNMVRPDTVPINH